MAKGTVRMNLQVSPEISDLISKIANDAGTIRSEVLRQAPSLMKVAHVARQAGKRIGLATSADAFETEIVGLL